MTSDTSLDDQIAALRAEIMIIEARPIPPTKHIAALCAVLATLEAQRWQPIETAPRDEETYLLAGRANTKIPGIIGWDHAYPVNTQRSGDVDGTRRTRH